MMYGSILHFFVESAIVGVSVCICNKLEGFVLAVCNLYLVGRNRELRGTVE